MKKLAAIAVLLGGCAVEYRAAPLVTPAEPGEPAQYVCVRHLASSGACLRSEWRCTAPLQLRGLDGTPRCVMPGSK